MLSNKYIYIFIFGGIGALIRSTLLGAYNVTYLVILFCNIIGCCLIGFLSDFIENNKVLNVGLCAGLCGGLTTVSTFCLETFKLADYNIFYSQMYIFVTVILCFIGVIIGIKLSSIIKGRVME